MTTPWAQWLFTAIFTALAIFSALRLLSTDEGRSGGWGLDVARGVMSVGMVAMMVPRIDPLPRVYWQVIFGVAAAYIAIRLVRRSLRAAPSAPGPAQPCGQHELHLVIGGVAMVYMLTAMPARQAMASGMDMTAMRPTGLVLPVLTWAFIGYFLVFAVRLGARLAVPVPIGPVPLGAGGPRGVVISPHLLGCAEVVMGIGMSYMLMTML